MLNINRNKLNHNIPAFTLIEMTIAMLIAAIAIAITFTAFRIVSGSYDGFSKKQGELADFVRLDKLLKQDFLASKRIIRSSDGVVLQLDAGVIQYTIDSAFVLRDQFSLRTDTFRQVIKHVNFSFENNDSESEQLVDLFSFESIVQAQMVPFRYYKLYSAQDLFK